MKALQQKQTSSNKAAKKGARANGSDFSSARGSEERHLSTAPQGGRGPRKNRDYDLENVSSYISFLIVLYCIVYCVFSTIVPAIVDCVETSILSAPLADRLAESQLQKACNLYIKRPSAAFALHSDSFSAAIIALARRGNLSQFTDKSSLWLLSINTGQLHLTNSCRCCGHQYGPEEGK
jgi:hypothetical protein